MPAIRQFAHLAELLDVDPALINGGYVRYDAETGFFGTVKMEPAGPDGAIQFNNGGEFGASDQLGYQESTGTLFVHNVRQPGGNNQIDLDNCRLIANSSGAWGVSHPFQWGATPWDIPDVSLGRIGTEALAVTTAGSTASMAFSVVNGAGREPFRVQYGDQYDTDHIIVQNVRTQNSNGLNRVHVGNMAGGIGMASDHGVRWGDSYNMSWTAGLASNGPGIVKVTDGGGADSAEGTLKLAKLDRDGASNIMVNKALWLTGGAYVSHGNNLLIGTGQLLFNQNVYQDPPTAPNVGIASTTPGAIRITDGGSGWGNLEANSLTFRDGNSSLNMQGAPINGARFLGSVDIHHNGGSGWTLGSRIETTDFGALRITDSAGTGLGSLTANNGRFFGDLRFGPNDGSGFGSDGGGGTYFAADGTVVARWNRGAFGNPFGMTLPQTAGIFWNEGVSWNAQSAIMQHAPGVLKITDGGVNFGTLIAGKVNLVNDTALSSPTSGEIWATNANVSQWATMRTGTIHTTGGVNATGAIATPQIYGTNNLELVGSGGTVRVLSSSLAVDNGLNIGGVGHATDSLTFSYDGGYRNAIRAQYFSSSPQNNWIQLRAGDGTPTGLVDVLTATGAGRVGIGTTDPQEMLHVNGNIRLGPSPLIYRGDGEAIFRHDGTTNTNRSRVDFTPWSTGDANLGTPSIQWNQGYFLGDVAISTTTAGLILKDRTTGNNWRLKVDNGVFGVELAS